MSRSYLLVEPRQHSEAYNFQGIVLMKPFRTHLEPFATSHNAFLAFLNPTRAVWAIKILPLDQALLLLA